jgi:Restriction Enzyme Adenine Methylase Associated
VAKRLGRHWLGIEQNPEYVSLAQARIEREPPPPDEPAVLDVGDRKRAQPRIAFARLLELNLLRAGQSLYFMGDVERTARIKADGRLQIEGFEGSIHQVGRKLKAGAPCNGWDHWYFADRDGALKPIDQLRQEARRQLAEPAETSPGEE